jgi:putative transposase
MKKPTRRNHIPAFKAKVALAAKIGELTLVNDFCRGARQSGTVAERKTIIDRSHSLPLTRQARELGISRGSLYYLPRPVSATDLAIMRRIDELHMEFPFADSRMLRDLLQQSSAACMLPR